MLTTSEATSSSHPHDPRCHLSRVRLARRALVASFVRSVFAGSSLKACDADGVIIALITLVVWDRRADLSFTNDTLYRISLVR